MVKFIMRILYYGFCMVFPILGLFIFGRYWIILSFLPIILIPLVNRLTDDRIPSQKDVDNGSGGS